MNQTDKDLLIFERGSLITKKNLLDIIQKFRHITPAGSPVQMRCYDITKAIGIHDWAPFEAILKTMSETGAFSFSITGGSDYGMPWGDDLATFVLSKKFDDIYRKISDRYHDVTIHIAEGKVAADKVRQVQPISTESELIKLVKSKIEAIDEDLLRPDELENIKQKIENFLDEKLRGESLLALRYRKFRAQTRTLWNDSNGFATNGKEYINPYFNFFEQYISEKKIRQRLADEDLWVESVTQGDEQHIMIGKRDNDSGDKVHIVMGKTGEIRIDGKDKAPVEVLRKAESILTTADGKTIKTTLEFFKNQN
ncbi:MAG: hypothetical protein PHT51_03525 [Patescibacteria group bacterium]|nr:hypothetical protein [Patescibacteria group bacterium]MDD4610429.1 hypothetical protein [Patescibacteria group bacterium]